MLTIKAEHFEVMLIKITYAFKIIIKDFRPSHKFDNPYLIIPWVTNDNSEHLCALVSLHFL